MFVFPPILLLITQMEVSSSTSPSSSLKSSKLRRQPWQDETVDNSEHVKRFKPGNVIQKPASDAKEFELQLQSLVTYLQGVGLLDLGLNFTQLAHPDLARIYLGCRDRPDFGARTYGLIHISSLKCFRDVCFDRISRLCEKQGIAQSRMPLSHFQTPLHLLHDCHSHLLIEFWFDLKAVCGCLVEQQQRSPSELLSSVFHQLHNRFNAEEEYCYYGSIFSLVETVNFFIHSGESDGFENIAATLLQLEERLLGALQVVVEEGKRMHDQKRGSLLDGILIEPLVQLAWDYLTGDTYFGADFAVCARRTAMFCRKWTTITGTAYEGADV
jgi:hypothetical protein